MKKIALALSIIFIILTFAGVAYVLYNRGQVNACLLYTSILEDEQAPSVGDLSLVLDGLSTPACVIKTVHVETVKFCDLTWDMVKLEGEDENFEQWKSGNIRYWTRDAAKRGYTFTDQTPITFERFEVVEVL